MRKIIITLAVLEESDVPPGADPKKFLGSTDVTVSVDGEVISNCTGVSLAASVDDVVPSLSLALLAIPWEVYETGDGVKYLSSVPDDEVFPKDVVWFPLLDRINPCPSKAS